MKSYRVIYKEMIDEKVVANSRLEAIQRVLNRLYLDWESAPLNQFEVIEE